MPDKGEGAKKIVGGGRGEGGLIFDVFFIFRSSLFLMLSSFFRLSSFLRLPSFLRSSSFLGPVHF